jgi:NTE family protein
VKKVGLALGGGAARGLAHIGVLEVLEREGISVDLIAGTSAGAAVGALYAEGKTVAKIKELVHNTGWRRLFSLIDLALPKSGFIEGARIKDLLRSVIGDIGFSNLEIPLSCVATDINSGEEVVISDGPVLEGVRASISIPVIFTAVRWRGRYLVDGGLVNPVPVSTVKDMGADFVIAVNVIPPIGVRTQPSKEAKEPGIFQTIMHSLYISSYSLVRSNLAGADIIIEPDLPNIGYGDFHRVNETIRRGEIAAEETLEQIKAALT